LIIFSPHPFFFFAAGSSFLFLVDNSIFFFIREDPGTTLFPQPYLFSFFFGNSKNRPNYSFVVLVPCHPPQLEPRDTSAGVYGVFSFFSPLGFRLTFSTQFYSSCVFSPQMDAFFPVGPFSQVQPFPPGPWAPPFIHIDII